MSNQPDDRLTNKDLLAIVIVLSLFIWGLFQLDSEWVMWIGFTTLGTTPPPEFPPPLFSDGREAFQFASILSLVGVLALLFLLFAEGDPPFGWIARFRSQWGKWRSRDAREGRDAAAKTTLPDVDLDG